MGVISNTPPEPQLSHDSSVRVVQVSPADLAKCQQWIGIEGLGQRLLRELAEFDAGLEQDLDDCSEYRLGALDNLGRSKQPHSVDKPDHVLLIAAEAELVAGVSVQQQVRRAHH